ncbi:DedA family protein [Entomomonas asaccharolytica]|uniref:DedA family protein n=1 Tax=Entomomonas asaccharolytica TaxID=2785331 RepID=A0A974NEQ9_9GAMM|nr:DedA family protein [Entomomonas asaccharolytica]QQP85261.1 DedA family protein [Entomomonas asaccharolytica]
MMEQLLNDYGYVALFIGTFLEGETILVLAGIAAAHEFLDLKTVIIVAFIGSYCGDQLWYFLGRYYGIALLQKRPKWQKSADKALIYFRKNPDLWVLTFRFMYGLRTIMPVAIGISGYSPKRYIILNGIGAIIWAIVLGSTSYYFGTIVLSYLKDYELIFLGGIVVLALFLWIRRFIKNRKSPQ